jgi:hypothetical protein
VTVCDRPEIVSSSSRHYPRRLEGGTQGRPFIRSDFDHSHLKNICQDLTPEGIFGSASREANLLGPNSEGAQPLQTVIQTLRDSFKSGAGDMACGEVSQV